MHIFNSLQGHKFKSAYLINNHPLQVMFENKIDVLHNSQQFPALWTYIGSDKAKQWRTAIFQRFIIYANKFTNNKQRSKGLMVVPVVCGVRDIYQAKSLCSSGLNVTNNLGNMILRSIKNPVI